MTTHAPLTWLPWCTRLSGLGAIVLALTLSGCLEGDPPILTKDALDGISVGGTARLADLTPERPDTVCVLYPYHTTVPPDEPESDRINRALADDGYRGDEMEWTIVFAGKNAVKHASFRRTGGLDIMASHEAGPQIRAMIPDGLTPAGCTTGAQAGFAKLVWHERTYLVFGRLD